MAWQIAPLIVPERRILISLYLFMAGIILFHLMPDIWHSGRYLNWLVTVFLLTSILGLGVAIYTRQSAGHDRGLFLFVVFTAGIALASLQFALHDQPKIKWGVTADINGMLIKIDGNADARSRLWISLGATSDIVKNDILPAGGIVRVTTDKWQDQQYIGGAIAMRVRLYPPPDRILHGTPDYGRRARVNDVLASGYVISEITMMPDDHAESIMHDVKLFLARYRAGFAAHLVDLMPKPAGAIAAALLVGERRFISEDVYNRFRDSGLAHLLAISGLHMGLICFGSMAVIRFFGALFPSRSSRFALHKYAAIIAAIIGGCYVLMSGAPVSALRAFGMAMLVVLAILHDRMALTLRNVCLAAFAILAFNPVALFTASFQLSFAATAILVIWYESRARRGPAKWHWSLRYPMALITMSFLSAMATAPFAAQHFGTVTPWGLVANIIGIPLTGLWIMPVGMVLTISTLFGLDWVVAPLMTAGLDALYYLADWIAGFPLAGWKVAPPGYSALVVMVTGVMISQLLIKPMARIGLGLVVIGGGIWAVRPVPDGVLFAVGRTPQLVLAGTNSMALSYAPLSDFLASMGELRMGQSIEQADLAKCMPACKHDFSKGISANIVMKAKGLTAACKDLETAFILTNVTPRYPCYSGKQIYNISQKTGYNYLIFIDKNKFKLINNFGSARQVCPALQPRPC